MASSRENFDLFKIRKFLFLDSLPQLYSTFWPHQIGISHERGWRKKTGWAPWCFEWGRIQSQIWWLNTWWIQVNKEGGGTGWGYFQRRWGRMVLLLPTGDKLTVSSKEAGIIWCRYEHSPSPDNFMDVLGYRPEDSSWFSWACVNNIPAWSLGQPCSEKIKQVISK